METSAKTSMNVTDVFMAIAKKLPLGAGTIFSFFIIIEKRSPLSEQDGIMKDKSIISIA